MFQDQKEDRHQRAKMVKGLKMVDFYSNRSDLNFSRINLKAHNQSELIAPSKMEELDWMIQQQQEQNKPSVFARGNDLFDKLIDRNKVSRIMQERNASTQGLQQWDHLLLYM